MPDYTMATGSTGTMMIRDTGSVVQFWITSNNSTTFNHNMPWTSTIDGYTYPGFYSHNYNANSGWNLVWQGVISVSQTVMFKLGSTGTAGLGGPTTFNQFILRSTVPSSPSVPSLSNVTSNSVDVTFTDGANGGAAIDSRQIGYGTNNVSPTNTISSDGSDTVSGLASGVIWHFWARTHNVNGWSAWSSRTQATTLKVPDAPAIPVLSSIGPVYMTVTWSAPFNGGAEITDYEVGYSTTPTLPPEFTISATSPHVLDGLDPGETYFVWIRAENSVGWGDWSPAANATTEAVVWVNDGGVWKKANVYVKYAGVWTIAAPYVRFNGIWKETT